MDVGGFIIGTMLAANHDELQIIGGYNDLSLHFLRYCSETGKRPHGNPASRPPRRLDRLPRHDRHPGARDRGGGARAARAPHRRRVRRASAPSPTSSSACAFPAACAAVTVEGVARGVPGAAHTDAAGTLRVEVTLHEDERARDERVRALEREYRAVVEEILDLRGADARIRAFLRSITEPGALADTSGYSPDLSLRGQDRAARDARRHRAAREGARAAARAARRAAGARAIRDDVQEGAEQQQREYFLRKQMESIRKELGEDEGSVADEYRTKIEEAGMPEAVREQAEKELGRLERMGDSSGESSMIRTYLDWLVARAVVEALGGAARPGARARGAGRRPRRPRGRQGPHHRVHRRAQAAPRARHDGGGTRRRRDPDPDRAARHRQDLDRRVDREGDRPRVRAHVAGRRARRGRDPRSPADIHRRASGTARPCPSRRGHDEPGDPAGRGRQGRRRLAGRPLVGAARGARPGTEPLVPRPLPGRRARPLRGPVHRDGEHGRDDPRAAARPHGGRALRRLHDRGEGRDRARLPAPAPAGAQRAAARTRSRCRTTSSGT